jgi:hypothetical protein
LNENADNRKSKARSPNFPFISLEQALDRARQFYDKEKRGAAPFKVAARHWGYSPTSSGSLQTIGALKSYGLMSDEGSGDSREVKLTDLSLRILLDTRPDSLERETYKRQAALTPAITLDVYAKWDSALPSEANLIHYLVLDREFNDKTAKRVAEIIQENDMFTDTSKSLSESFLKKIADDTGVTSPAYIPGPMPGFPIGRQLSAPDDAVVHTGSGELRAGSSSMRAKAPREERIIGPTGDITLCFFGEPTWEAYEFLRKYLELRQSLLKSSPKAE